MSKNTLLSELINYISANASGNVVIAAPSSGYALDVTGTGRFTGDVTFDGGTGAINFTASTTITNTASSGFTAIYANGGGIYLGGAASSNHLSILSGGNVGIGLTNPQSQLHINGVLTLTESGFDTVRLHSITHAHSSGSNPNNYIGFNVSDGAGTTAERMRINGAGSLGVNTNSPAYTLDVNGTGRISGVLIVRNTSSTPSIWSGQYGGAISILGDNATAARYIDLSIVDSTGALASQGLRIINGGLVGIGITSPSQPLHVYATTTTTSSFFETNAANSYIGLKSTAGTCYIGNVGYGMTFEAGGSERMRITSGGQLLIGQTTASGSTNGMYFRPGIESGFIVTSDVALQLSRLGTTGIIQTFYSGTTRVGQISVTGSTVSLESNSSGGLSIASTGAATFISSVTAGNRFASTIGTSELSMSATGGYNTASYIQAYNTDTSTFKNLTLYGRDICFLAQVSTDSERMRITSGGSVGIGTTSPSAKLHVEGNMYISDTLSLGNWFDANSKFSGYNTDGLFSANARPCTITTPNGGQRIRFGYNDYGSGQYWGRIGFLGNTNWSIGHVGGAGNDISIGTGYRGENLYLYSNGNYSFTGSNVSDIRLKENINTLEFNSVDKLLALTPKSYYMKSNPELIRYGFIAQEVQEILPDLINGIEAEGTYLGLDYNGITALLVKAIKEQQAQIEELKQLINK